MGDSSISVALDPYGDRVPIDEADEDKTNYYRCTHCGEIVNAIKGKTQQHHYRHREVSDEDPCPRSVKGRRGRLDEELQTSTVEKEERNSQIRVCLSEAPGERVRLFGIIPVLEWDDIDAKKSVDQVLETLSITSSGIDHPPVPGNFDPSNSEVTFDLEPTADKFVVEIDGNEDVEKLAGEWRAEGLTDGDLFLGDQSRARRYHEKDYVKPGEWVYLATDERPDQLPDSVIVYSLDRYTILSFPAQEETENILEKYGKSLKTEQHGFDADVILPATTHPTSEAPIESSPGDQVAIGITPSQEIDPVFEVVSIPKRDEDIIEIDPTGPGKPRCFTTIIPDKGSRRVSIHQPNSNRHRFLSLHPQNDTSSSEKDGSTRSIGLKTTVDNEVVFLSPIDGQTQAEFNTEINPITFPDSIEYIGPEGLEIGITAVFDDESPYGPKITRSTTEIDSLLPEIGHWAHQGCEKVTFSFDGLGSVHLVFPDVSPVSSSQITERGETQHD